MKYHVFLISDSTAITAERLCHGLFAQFPAIEFDVRILRFIDTVEKIEEVCQQVNAAAQGGTKPIVFSTLAEGPMRDVLQQADAHILDVMSAFLEPMEKILGIPPTPAIGQTHGQGPGGHYNRRMDAVAYALLNDDGQHISHYDQADVILIGVSRSGKTPVCLYLALEYGLFAANYPFVDEDLELLTLPRKLQPYRDKLFGLTITPQRLHEIRQARRPDSEYAALARCEREVRLLVRLYEELHIPYIDVTRYSVEEIATRILARLP